MHTLHHAAVLGLAWLQVSTALRVQHEEARGGPGPVVIVGLGGKPTSAVKLLLSHLGVEMCHYTSQKVELEKDGQGPQDNDYTMTVEKYIPQLMRAAGGEASKAFSYHDSPAFWTAVSKESKAAHLTKECIKVNRKRHHRKGGNYSWGYKNNDHLYLLPVIDEAFYRTERIVAVVRDPRDTCAGHHKDEFTRLQRLANDVTNRSDSNQTKETACYLYWADVWKSLLAQYGEESRFKVVRIEDLVIPKPSADNKALGCLLGHAGVRPKAEARRQRLVTLHDDVSTYMGHTRKEKVRTRQEASAASAGGVLHEVMSALGYRLDAYGLEAPRAQAVCKP
mmetsp:Transcript_89824/g.279532  ORF Transcript_89824/g.279532 Transcript_89824/m.279532 type:complete len:336 (+) Transcript_89824:59-1066(+)